MLKTEDEINKAAIIVQGLMHAMYEGDIPFSPGSIVDMAIFAAYSNLFCWILHGDCENGKKVQEWLDRGEVELRDLGYEITRRGH